MSVSSRLLNFVWSKNNLDSAILVLFVFAFGFDCFFNDLRANLVSKSEFFEKGGHAEKRVIGEQKPGQK